jgi:hypothetical protein
MNLIGSAVLEFNPNDIPLNYGLSAVVQIGKSLWVANDETVSLERLLLQGEQIDSAYKYGEHRQFVLSDYLRLPMPPPFEPKKIVEADIEGLAYDDGYLWLVGSHSRVRKKPRKDKGDSVNDNIKRLADVGSDGNRFILARIPLDTDNYVLERVIEGPGKNRTAAQLAGDHNSSELTSALKKDEHLKDYLSIPSKDNGVDIEGLAVAGKRIFIGLRGPVLRGFAVILELELEEIDDYTLKLKKIGPDDQPYRKHFLQLHGLGIRDLCVQGNDLLILAGPTMELDGPVTIFRWQGGAQPKEQSLIFKEDLSILMSIPFGEGEDHAEGLTLFAPNEDKASSVLVVYDAASKRCQMQKNALEADIFTLP